MRKPRFLKLKVFILFPFPFPIISRSIISFSLLIFLPLCLFVSLLPWQISLLNITWIRRFLYKIKFKTFFHCEVHLNFSRVARNFIIFAPRVLVIHNSLLFLVSFRYMILRISRLWYVKTLYVFLPLIISTIEKI